MMMIPDSQIFSISSLYFKDETERKDGRDGRNETEKKERRDGRNETKWRNKAD